MTRVQFVVLGTPVPQGSKVRTRFGVREDNPRTLPWRQDVAATALRAMTGRPVFTGPVAVELECVFARPKSHFRSGKLSHLLRPAAPYWCQTKPDADKLARAIGDALSGIVVRDDSQIVRWEIQKRYALDTDPGAHAVVHVMAETELEA